MRDVILIVLVFGGAFVALLRPYYGLLLFIWLGLLNPQSYTWGVARTLPLSQVAALATMVGMMVSGELKKLPKQRELYLLVLLWCLFGVTTLGALEPTLAITKLGEVSKILLMAVLTMILINSRERLHSIVQIIGLSLGFHALRAGVFVITTGGQYNVYGPENSFLGTNNAIGLALGIVDSAAALFLVEEHAYRGEHGVLAMAQHADLLFRVLLREAFFRLRIVEAEVLREALDIARCDLDLGIAATVGRAFRAGVACSHGDWNGLAVLH